MKHAVLALALSTLPASLFAQGPLTPPGAPAPTMKSLDQLEARTPITSVPYTISTPGSYYLTANLSVASGSAISLAAGQVTLDLNGFALSSTDPGNTGAGILLTSGLTDVSILNGHIAGGVTYSGGYSGPGFSSGISGPGTYNIRVSGITVSGCLGDGIHIGFGYPYPTVVESCTIRAVGGYGIVATSVSHSIAYQCGNHAVYAADTASDCVGISTGSGNGVTATTANNCQGQSSTGYGLYAANAINCSGQSTGSGDGLYAVTAESCQGQSDSGSGLYAVQTATGCYGYSLNGTGLSAAAAATGCSGVSSNGAGLFATTANNCYGQTSGTGYGLQATVANTCSGQNNNNSMTGTCGLRAYIANNCYAIGTAGLCATIANSCYSSIGDSNIGYPYNMP